MRIKGRAEDTQRQRLGRSLGSLSIVAWIMAGSVGATEPATASAAPPAARKAIRVSVGRFGTGQVESGWSFEFSHAELGPVMTSLLTNELVNQPEFKVIERQYLDAVLNEQDQVSSGRFDEKTMATKAKIQGLQFVVFGDVVRFSREESRFGGLGAGKIPIIGKKGIGGLDVGTSKVEVVVTARLVDTTTGEAVVKADAKDTVKDFKAKLVSVGPRGGAAAHGGTQAVSGELEKALQKAVQALAMNLAEQVRAKDIKGRTFVTCLETTVADVDGNRLSLVGGSNKGVVVGDYFQIVRNGEPITNPDDGSIIGYKQESLGLARVVEVQQKMSVTDLVGATTKPPAVKDTARRTPPPDEGNSTCEEPETVAVSNPPPAQTSPAPASDTAQTTAAGPPAAVAPPASVKGTTTPAIGTWRLHPEETARYVMRRIAAIVGPIGMMSHDEDNDPSSEDLAELRRLQETLEVRSDGSFRIEYVDFATRGRTTVSGRWEQKGDPNIIDLVAAERDGRPVESTVLPFKLSTEGLLYGQGERDLKGPQGALGGTILGGVQWPDFGGAVFARSESARAR